MKENKLSIQLRNVKVRRMIIFAMLVAIEIVFCFTALGTLPIAGIPATTAHLPVIIACIICGLPEIAGLGLILGISSIIVFSTSFAANPSSPFFSPFVINGNWMSGITAIIPRILFPIILYYLLKLVYKLKNNGIRTILVFLSALFATFCHSFMVLTCIFINQTYLMKLPSAYFSFIMTGIGLNVVMEMLLAGLVGIVVAIRLRNIILPQEREESTKDDAITGA